MRDDFPASAEVQALVQKARQNVGGILHEVFHHSDAHQALLVYDSRSLLSTVLAEAYKAALPKGDYIDFDKEKPEAVLERLNALHAKDMVVLVQSTSFRLDAFRIRVELFKRKIKVIEHPHLSRMSDDEVETYVDALAYDSNYFRGTGRALKARIDAASSGVIESGGERLVYASAFESAKLNIGDYSEMPNMGGQFPIGEVFTEAKELTALSGRAKVYCFGDVNYKVNIPEKPITLIIEEGKVVGCEESTPAFDLILSNIRRDEEVVWVRELGFGLNKALSKSRFLGDTGSYERMCGVHVSLGKKHGMYGKPGFKRRDGLYHVDVFIDTERVLLDDQVVFENEAWCVA